jgi:uncharacterized protein (DUF697 family)
MLNVLKQARAAFSMLNPSEVHKRIGRPITFGLVAASDREFSDLERFLLPSSLPTSERDDLRAEVYRAGSRGVPGTVDVVLYQHGVPGPKGTYMFHRDDPQRTVREIVAGNEELALGLARRYPAFRKFVVESTIHSVSRENAFFSIASAIPDVLPNLLELPWAIGEFASDLTFLTANQVRMAFLIAAASGKDVGFAEQKAEIAGIAAAAFGWRAIARELVGKIPFGGGLIPKGAIAYAATYATGKGLERLHEGAPFTRIENEEAYRAAFRNGKKVARQIAERATS